MPHSDRDFLVDDALADRLDPLRLQQEMIVDEIDRAVAQLFEMLELGDDVLRAAGAPLPFIEDRNVAKHAGPGAAPRGLHGGEASIDRTAGTSSGMDSTKSSFRLSRSGKGH